MNTKFLHRCFFSILILICAHSGYTQTEWTVPMQVSLVAGEQDSVFFGTMIGASDTLDPGIDVLNPPPIPGGLDGFFEISDPLFPELSSDFRSNTDSTNTWTLKITGTNGSVGTITWDVSGFPGAILEIQQDAMVLADMLSQSSLNFTGDQDFSIFWQAPPILLFRVERTTGDVFAQGSFIGGGADLAERIHVSGPVEPGDVVELDPTKPGHYRKARAFSKLIAGVITTNPGFTLGNNPDEMAGAANKADGRPLLALMGRVPVKATTENGAINPGDLLTVSSKPGYAMRCTEAKGCEGAIIGKALEGLERGEGLVLVLVMSH